MTDCPDCAAARADRLHAIYRAACKGCSARAIANGPLFWSARQSGKQFGEYRRALDAAGVTHAEVKSWAEVSCLA